MADGTDDIIQLAKELADEEGLKATVTESTKGALISGAGAFFGGLLGGPPGIALGAAAGGLMAMFSANDFKPASEILMSMPQHQKDRLAEKVRRVMANNGIATVASLVMSIAGGSAALRSKVIYEVVNHLKNELAVSLK